MSIAVGRFCSHPSPNIKLYGGVFICVKCGATAVNTLVNLQKPCGILTANLRNNLKAYVAGKALKGFKGWP